MSRLVTRKRGVFGASALVATVAGMLAVNQVGGEEGLRLRTYKDIVGIPTYCYGETQGARMGQTYTKAQCDALLLKRLDEFAGKVEKCIHRPMSDRTEVAFVSLAYNIGWGGFCASTAARLYNAGDHVGACNAMMRFDIAGGRENKALKGRRGRERAMCLAGLREAAQ